MNYLPNFISQNKRNVKEELTFYIDIKPRVKVNIIIKGREKHNLNPKIYKAYIKELLKEIHLLTDIRKKKINIEYHPTNKKKLFPLKGQVLQVENVNSGVSFPYSNENETNIIIYRKEEFYKVLTHELLHLYHIIPEEKELKAKIIEIYPNLRNTININETFVELNAMLINIKIIGKLTGVNEKEMLIKECSWSKNQYDNILKHFDITNSIEVNKKFKEKGTHVFSYYVLKWLYFNKISCVYLDKNKIKNKKSLRMTINDIENYK